MRALSDKKILILLFGILICVGILIVINQKKEGFFAKIETPASDEYNIKTDDVAGAYEPTTLEKVAKKTVKHVADILMRQQKDRINWMRILWDEEKKTKEAKFTSEINLAMAVKNLVFATSSLVSIDPIQIIKAIPMVAVAGVGVEQANKAMEMAKEAYKNAKSYHAEARKLYAIAAEQEFLGKQLQLYGDPDARTKRAACSRIMPGPAPSVAP